MAYKVIEPENIDIYDTPTHTTKKKVPFSFDNINITTSEMWHYAIWGAIGLLILWVGITNAGSYYLPATRLSNTPATFFYSWQMGNIFIITGILTLYHTFFGRGKP
jgi:hypothetical protein